jgi:hypothetical protein
MKRENRCKAVDEILFDEKGKPVYVEAWERLASIEKN